MRRMRSNQFRLMTIIACAMLSAPALCAAAAESKDTAAAPAKLPDWGGIWEIIFRPSNPGAPQAPPSLTPEYAAKLKAYQDEAARGGNQDTPAANCVPPGMPGIMNQPYPIEFLMTPGKITVVIEAYSQTRRIFTDGRKHPDDPDPTFNGHSIGHWEGDTLIVDTVGFTTDTPLGRS